MTESKGGITFLELLLVVFVTLKLCKVISWSWWYVMTPLWIPVLLALIVFVGAWIWNHK
jgi:hypothetical protein